MTEEQESPFVLANKVSSNSQITKCLYGRFLSTKETHFVLVRSNVLEVSFQESDRFECLLEIPQDDVVEHAMFVCEADDNQPQTLFLLTRGGYFSFIRYDPSVFLSFPQYSPHRVTVQYSGKLSDDGTIFSRKWCVCMTGSVVLVSNSSTIFVLLVSKIGVPVQCVFQCAVPLPIHHLSGYLSGNILHMYCLTSSPEKCVLASTLDLQKQQLLLQNTSTQGYLATAVEKDTEKPVFKMDASIKVLVSHHSYACHAIDEQLFVFSIGGVIVVHMGMQRQGKIVKLGLNMDFSELVLFARVSTIDSRTHQFSLVTGNKSVYLGIVSMRGGDLVVRIQSICPTMSLYTACLVYNESVMDAQMRQHVENQDTDTLDSALVLLKQQLRLVQCQRTGLTQFLTCQDNIFGITAQVSGIGAITSIATQHNRYFCAGGVGNNGVLHVQTRGFGVSTQTEAVPMSIGTHVSVITSANPTVLLENEETCVLIEANQNGLSQSEWDLEKSYLNIPLQSTAVQNQLVRVYQEGVSISSPTTGHVSISYKSLIPTVTKAICAHITKDGILIVCAHNADTTSTTVQLCQVQQGNVLLSTQFSIPSIIDTCLVLNESSFVFGTPGKLVFTNDTGIVTQCISNSADYATCTLDSPILSPQVIHALYTFQLLGVSYQCVTLTAGTCLIFKQFNHTWVYSVTLACDRASSISLVHATHPVTQKFLSTQTSVLNTLEQIKLETPFLNNQPSATTVPVLVLCGASYSSGVLLQDKQGNICFHVYPLTRHLQALDFIHPHLSKQVFFTPSYMFFGTLEPTPSLSSVSHALTEQPKKIALFNENTLICQSTGQTTLLPFTDAPLLEDATAPNHPVNVVSTSFVRLYETESQNHICSIRLQPFEEPTSVVVLPAPILAPLETTSVHSTSESHTNWSTTCIIALGTTVVKPHETKPTAGRIIQLEVNQQKQEMVVIGCRNVAGAVMSVQMYRNGLLCSINNCVQLYAFHNPLQIVSSTMQLKLVPMCIYHASSFVLQLQVHENLIYITTLLHSVEIAGYRELKNTIEIIAKDVIAKVLMAASPLSKDVILATNDNGQVHILSRKASISGSFLASRALTHDEKYIHMQRSILLKPALVCGGPFQPPLSEAGFLPSLANTVIGQHEQRELGRLTVNTPVNVLTKTSSMDTEESVDTLLMDELAQFTQNSVGFTRAEITDMLTIKASERLVGATRGGGLLFFRSIGRTQFLFLRCVLACIMAASAAEQVAVREYKMNLYQRKQETVHPQARPVHPKAGIYDPFNQTSVAKWHLFCTNGIGQALLTNQTVVKQPDVVLSQLVHDQQEVSVPGLMDDNLATDQQNHESFLLSPVQLSDKDLSSGLNSLVSGRHLETFFTLSPKSMLDVSCGVSAWLRGGHSESHAHTTIMATKQLPFLYNFLRRINTA